MLTCWTCRCLMHSPRLFLCVTGDVCLGFVSTAGAPLVSCPRWAGVSLMPRGVAPVSPRGVGCCLIRGVCVLHPGTYTSAQACRPRLTSAVGAVDEGSGVLHGIRLWLPRPPPQRAIPESLGNSNRKSIMYKLKICSSKF